MIEATTLMRPELGTKRTCQNCGARFYDLSREPITCPKCGHAHTAEMFNRMKRSRPAEAVARAVPKRGADDAAVAEVDDVADDIVDDEEEEEEETEAEFEDASELGEDDEDMAEVIDNIDDAEPDEGER